MTTSDSDRSAARSIAFESSRMLPGQPYALIAATASADSVLPVSP